MRTQTPPPRDTGVAIISRSDEAHHPSPPPKTDKLHVHFGAGRLGFGLVLPALENAGSPYVILNRPSAQWMPVVERERDTQQHVGVQVRLDLAARFS